MKAEIYYEDEKWSWKIKRCGVMVAWGRYYTRKDSAKRGLSRFIREIQRTYHSFIMENLK